MSGERFIAGRVRMSGERFIAAMFCFLFARFIAGIFRSLRKLRIAAAGWNLRRGVMNIQQKRYRS